MLSFSEKFIFLAIIISTINLFLVVKFNAILNIICFIFWLVWIFKEELQQLQCFKTCEFVSQNILDYTETLNCLQTKYIERILRITNIYFRGILLKMNSDYYFILFLLEPLKQLYVNKIKILFFMQIII